MRLTRLVLTVVVLVLTSGLLHPNHRHVCEALMESDTDDTNTNKQMDSADYLPLGLTMTGKLNSQEDVDFFVMRLCKAGVGKVDFAVVGNGKADIRLLDSSNKVLKEKLAVNGQASLPLDTGGDGQMLYLRLRLSSGSGPVGYTATATIGECEEEGECSTEPPTTTSTTEPDTTSPATTTFGTSATGLPRDGFEPNEDIRNAHLLQPHSVTSGFISSKTDEDFFLLRACAFSSVVVTLDFHGDEYDLDLELINLDNATVGVSDSATSNRESVAALHRGNRETAFFVRVFGYGGATGPYSLTTNVRSCEARCPQARECTTGWKGPLCQAPDCPGEPDCNNRGDCVTTANPPICINCMQGWTGLACDIPVTTTSTDPTPATSTSSTTVGTGTLGTTTAVGGTTTTSTTTTTTRLGPGGVTLPPISIRPGIDINITVLEFDPHEPNNDPANATVLTVGEQLDAVATREDNDYYVVTGCSSEELTVAMVFSDDRGNLDMQLYGPEGNEIAASISGTNRENVTVQTGPTAAEATFVVQVFGFRGAQGPYRIQACCASNITGICVASADPFSTATNPFTRPPVSASAGGGGGGGETAPPTTSPASTATTAAVTYAPDANEPNDSADEATQLDIDVEFATQGTISNAQDNDYFEITACPDEDLLVVLQFSHAQGNLDMTMANAAGLTAGSESTTDNERISVSVTGTGAENQIFYVRVYGYEGATGTYAIQACCSSGLVGLCTTPTTTSTSSTTTSTTSSTITNNGNSFSTTTTTTVATTTTAAVTYTADANEPNDISGTPIQTGSQNEGTISTPGDNDMFVVTGCQGEDLVIVLGFSHAQGDLDLEVVDAQGTVVTSDSITDNERVTVTAGFGENATFTVNVQGYEAATGPYILQACCASSLSGLCALPSTTSPFVDSTSTSTSSAGVTQGTGETTFRRTSSTSVTSTSSISRSRMTTEPSTGVEESTSYSPYTTTSTTATTTTMPLLPVEDEPNSLASAATFLPPDVLMQGSIGSGGDRDFFEVPVCDDSSLSVTLTCTGTCRAVRFNFFNSLSEIIADEVVTSASATITKSGITGSKVYVSVRPQFSIRVSYTLIARVDGCGVPETDGNEPNDGAAISTALSPGHVSTGVISDTDDVDFFSMTACSSGVLSFTISFSHAEGDLDLRLFDSRGSVVDSSETALNREVVYARGSPVALPFYARVQGSHGATGAYTIVAHDGCCTTQADCGASLFCSSGLCEFCGACPSGQFRVGCDDSHAGQCRDCAPCPAGSIRVDCGRSSPGTCQACPPGHYTVSGRNECVSARNCVAGQFVLREPSPSTDRVCASCPTGTFSTAQNAQLCQSPRACVPPKVETFAPTPTSDRQCDYCELGVAFYHRPSGVCKPVSSCPAGAHVATPPTIASDVICETESYVCAYGQRSVGANSMCNCTAFGDACTVCNRHDSLEQRSDAVLLMLYAQPVDYTPITSLTITDLSVDAVSTCATYCRQYRPQGCVGFTHVQTSTTTRTCTLVSSYRSVPSDAPTARFYTLPQCQSCEPGFAVDNLGCTRITSSPEFPNNQPSPLIPINVEPGTAIANLTATSDAPGEQAVLTYEFAEPNSAHEAFAIDSTTGVVTVTRPLLSPVTVRLTVIATDSRPQCNQYVGTQLNKQLGPCSSQPFTLEVRVAALLGCPSDINEYVSPIDTNATVSWASRPRFPASTSFLTLALYRDGMPVSPTATTFTVPVGQTVFAYKSVEALSIGDQLECSFTVSIRQGFFMEAEDVDLRETESSHLAFVLSSRGLADTARPAPFVSDLASPFFIGVRSASGRPLIISPPEGVEAEISVALSWCTTNAPIPQNPRPRHTVAAPVNVTLAGFTSTEVAQPPVFTDQGSWILTTSTRSCINIEAKSTKFSKALEFVTLEVGVVPPPQARRRRSLPEDMVFIPSFPSLLVVDLQDEGGNKTDANLDGAVTFEDLVAPQFLACPPAESERTFAVVGDATEATVTLPAMSAFDTIDKSPVIEYPFQSANLSAIDSPHSVTVYAVDSSNNRRACTFDVLVTVDEHELKRTETVQTWRFPIQRRVADVVDLVYFTHTIPIYSSDIMTFDADLTTLTKLQFSLESPSTNVPFVVRFRPQPVTARIVVDARWLANGTGAAILFGKQENALAFVRVEDFRYDDEPSTVAPQTKDFALLEQDVAASEEDGLVGVFGKTDELPRPFSFTRISVVLRFLGAPDARGEATWTMVNGSYIGVEFEYNLGHSTVTTTNGSTVVETPRSQDVRGFLALRDQSPPLFSFCPDDISVHTAPGRGSAEVSWPTPTSTDNREVVSTTGSVPSGTTFGVVEPGMPHHVVTYVSRDLFDNTATCEFEVRVVDNEPPVTSAPRMVYKTLPPNAAVVSVVRSEWEPVNVTDNSEEQGTWAAPTLVWDNATATYGLGVHVIGMRYEDAFGNNVTTTAVITVNDVTPPSVVCPSDIERLAAVGESSSVAKWELVAPTDNNGLAVHVSMNRTSGSAFAIGHHVVLVEATDAAGLTATCTFTVTVVGQSTQAPTPPPGGTTIKQPQASQSSASTGIIAGAAAAGALLLILIIAVLIFVNRMRAKSRAPQDWDDIFQLMAHLQASEDGFRYPRELSRPALKLLGDLGKGAFGVVHKGMLKEHANIPGYLVAVKSLHEDASLADRQELLEEAAVTAQFTSPHVVELVGVVTVGNPVYVVVEFMEHGALKSYLEKNDVPEEKRLLWAGDCCEGLAHIHGKGFIHRDVAARNVLLSSEMRCKISDFGLAREMEEDDTYYKSRGGQLPVRWTAIEALEERKFNEKTDVWSCGILLHEMWTRAELPYKGWSNQKVWVEVAAGYRLPKPDGCRDDVYEHMLACWSESQADRPTFAALAEFFRRLHPDPSASNEHDGGYLELHPTGSLEKTASPTDSGNLYDMGSNNDVAASGADLYDMGDGGDAATDASALNTADASNLYDMGAANDADTQDTTAATGADLYDMGDGGEDGAAFGANDPDNLYDMGSDEPSAMMPSGRQELSGADLYDMGDGVDAGHASSVYDMGGNDNLYDMGENDESGGDASNLYDMGGDEPSASLPAARFGARNSTGNAAGDLYDMGDDDTTGTARPPLNTANSETFGFGDDLYHNTDNEEQHINAPAGSRQRGDVTEADVGKRVHVQGYTCNGVLRFVGPHHVTSAMRCGVELDEPLGKNDGSIRGHRYFKCKPAHGVLATMHKVMVLDE
ncbi:TK/RTKC protein kinase [Salpingoeca rosetta]|uniref:TK/RTKC protein kinase n=1 Tax=Salpingoeca rosetta (strain ATCC 50818 / BSB-021) TaxID=946362 RepID=F2UAL0_SALR5|nr:TK/RTKC protein kinase [Salpingoeca rosetta]EGD73426.1 TK/RTKC protein kinase [Salpingoeca rosetta]|eukprot:XP_004993708.1 TK/RTKC protein kinase [Salpingoeca rosetta]